MPPTIYTYNKEKKRRSFNDKYLMAGLFGVFAAIVLIVGTKGLMFLIGLLIKYYLWVIGVIVAFVILRHFVRRKRLVVSE